MIQYGVATTQTVYMGYSGLTITAKVAKGGVLAAIAGSVTDNSDGSYIVPLAAAETQSPVVTLVVSAPGVSSVALYLVTESNYTAALASALGTTNTTVAGWLTSGIALTTGALSTISGYVSALSIPSAAAIATAVWATIASGSTSILTVLAGLYGWTVGQVTGYAGGQAPPSAASIASAVAAPSAATIASAVAAPSAATIATAVWATIASGTTSALAAIGGMFGLLPASKMAAQSDVTGATSTLAGDIAGIPTVTPPTAGDIATAIDVPGALTDYGAAKTTDVTGAEGTLASAIAAIPTTGGSGGGSGLTSDQMTALENAEAAITTLNAKIAANMPQIVVVAPVGADGSTLYLIKGDTYDAAGIDGRAISIIVPLAGEPTGLATATFAIVLPGQLAPITIPAPVIDSVGQTTTFTFGLTATVTSMLFSGEYNILATFAGGSITSVIHEGTLNVN